jgi:hypothetical protein
MLDIEKSRPELHQTTPEIVEYESSLNHPDEIVPVKRTFNIGKVGVESFTYRPPKVVDETPVVVVKGFSASRKAYSAFARSMAAHGRIVTIYGTDRKEDLHDPLHAQAKIAVGVGKIIMRAEDADLIDTIGHSMGNSVQARAAAMFWRHTRSIMATGGAGLHPYGFLNMTGKLGKTGAVEVAPNALSLHHKSAAGLLIDECIHNIRNIPLLLSEGIHTAVDDVHPYLEVAKDHDVKIGSLMFGKDTFFKPHHILQTSGHYFDYHDTIPDAFHVHPQLHPYRHGKEQVVASLELNQPQLKSVQASGQ